MSRFVFKLPDLGEGTVDAEIVAWRVKPGDAVKEDDIVAEVMTDKAVVEVSAPVTGKIVSIAGEPGDRIAVGTELISFDLDTASVGGSSAAAAPTSVPPDKPASIARVAVETTGASEPIPIERARVRTSPAIRRQAREAGIDLYAVAGSGPHGRITRQDFDAAVAANANGAQPAAARIDAADAIEEVKVIGLRRVIAQRMVDAKRTIPHFAYVEELDVTELESLRSHLNASRERNEQLTYLPFLVVALTRALRDFPECNALYDAERNVLLRHRAVHVGIATQTPDGLKVPVVRNAQNRTLWDIAAEIRRVSEAARTNTATREELSGSTITLSSLGKLGGIVSTPIINAPELAIIGVNRAVERPVVVGGAVTVRRMMNLSSSFDHRFIDGHVAAAMIQQLKELLEHPATLFIPAATRGAR
jgi:2-oxoisovalerate dehydrogenase E2 component (dihydrolipoyl transacylase)